LNFAKAIRHREPELLERFRCLDIRRAVVKDEWKLIHLAGEPDELFDLDRDPLEETNRLFENAGEVWTLDQQLNGMTRHVEATRDALSAGTFLDLEQDEQLKNRLRGLGYIE